MTFPDPILIVAPAGRDAQVVSQLVGSAGMASLVDEDGSILLDAIRSGEGAGAFLTDEGYAHLNLSELRDALKHQPLWSDFPFVLLTSRGGRNSDGAPEISSAHMTILERPCHPTSLVAAARTLMRTRARQRMAGRQLNELEATRVQLRNLADTLEVQVSERTRDLATANARLTAEISERERAEARLLQAQKMEAVGQLTGGVAHDFNNLLTSVIGALELLLRKAADPMTRQLVEIALSSAEKGANLTAQLLAFSRRQRLDPTAIDPNEIVQGMVEMLKRILGQHIEVETRLVDPVWHALADPTQLEVMILNLAINARDAMPHGGRLEIETRNISAREANSLGELSDQDYVALIVDDTGSGMPPDIVARAFEPFFTTKETGKGTGLGLAQLYGFAKQSGGAARIESEVGIGSKVWLYLPRTLRDIVPPISDTRVPDQGRRGRILIVDDDENVRIILETMLETLGYDVVAAGHGPAALEVFEAGQFSLVLTDIAMPLMSGVELARKIRARSPDTPILFATGYADFQAFGPELSDQIIVRKPYHIADVAEQIDAALGTTGS